MLRDLRNLPGQIYVLCAGAFINRVGSFVMIFMTLYLREELGYSVQFATSCIGVFGLGGMVATLVGGQLADQIGRRACMLFGLFGGAAMLLLLRTMQSPILILIGLFLFAFIADMYRPASSAMISDLAPPELRPFAYSLMYVTVNLGFAFAPPLGGWLSSYSFDLLFWVDAATMAVYGIVIAFAVRETRPVGAEESHRLVNVLRTYAGIFRDRTFVLFFIGTFLTAAVYLQSMSTLPVYLRTIGIGKLQYGQLIAINGLLIAVAQLPLTVVLRRFEPMTSVIWGSVLIAVGFGLTISAKTPLALAGTIVIWTVGEIMQAAFMRTVVADLAPPEMRGRYMGCFGLSWASALMIGPPAGGWVLDRFGADLLWSSCVCVAIAGAVAYERAWYRLRVRKERPAENAAVTILQEE